MKDQKQGVQIVELSNFLSFLCFLAKLFINFKNTSRAVEKGCNGNLK